MNRLYAFRLLPSGTQLYRVDKTYYGMRNDAQRRGPITGNMVYPLPQPTYFLETEGNLQIYARYFPYGKEFTVNQDIYLIDMNNRRSLDAVLSQIPDEQTRDAVRTAFQVSEDGQVLRHSTPETKHLDDVALSAICALGADGYYTRRQEGFHAEIGLCPRAFRRITLERTMRVAPPMNVPRRRTMRNRNRNLNNAAPRAPENRFANIVRQPQMNAVFRRPLNFGAANNVPNYVPEVRRMGASMFDMEDM
jgi:hypothetical protein